MTGAVAVAAFVGLLSLLAGVALGWYLRRTNERCSSCGDQLACERCRQAADLPRSSTTSSIHPH
jgi:hypothetical protein